MHVAIPDQHRVGEPADEFDHALLVGLDRQHAEDLAVARILVFIVCKDTEHLGEVFGVHWSFFTPVKAPDGKSGLSVTGDTFGYAIDLIEGHKVDFRYVDPDLCGQFHRREFCLGHVRMSCRGQLDDPVAAAACDRDRQSAILALGFDRREFELHAGKREAQRALCLLLHHFCIGLVGLRFLGVDGDGAHCAWKIVPELCEKVVLAHGFYARAAGEVVAKRAFGKEVGEERLDFRSIAACVRNDFAIRILVGERQRWPILVGKVDLVECEDARISIEARNRSNARLTQKDIESRCVDHVASSSSR